MVQEPPSRVTRSDNLDGSWMMHHAPPHSLPHRQKTILLVEENPALLSVLRGVLKEAGYAVLDCRDGQVAAQQCEQQSGEVDLVLSDVVMPGLLGTELAKQVEERWPRMRVVLFSGHPEAERHVEGIEGIGTTIPFLKKPISRDALLKTIRGLLAGPTRPPSGEIHTVYITRSKTYLLACSACQERREVHVSELPHSTKPYSYGCPCGESTLFRLISFRRAPRKTVQLTATVVASAPRGTMRLPCEIEDISTKGMRVRTEPIPEFRPEAIRVVLTLPGRSKRTLQIPCFLRRSDIENRELRLGLEFQKMAADDEEALAGYLDG
jgi:DNA-binding response OmpR family regulator